MYCPGINHQLPFVPRCTRYQKRCYLLIHGLGTKKHGQCFTLPRKSNLGVCRLSVMAALVQSSLPYAVSAQYELWTSTDTRPSNFARRRMEKIWRSQARTAGSDPAGVPPCLTDWSATGENIVVGGENRWKYSSFVARPHDSGHM